MNQIKEKFRWSLIVAAVVVAISGCTSPEEFYEDASLSRQSAYRQWQAQKERQVISETRIDGELTVEDCLKVTLLNNKTLQQAIEQKEIARGEQIRSYSAILPRADLRGEYRRLDEVSSFDVGGNKVSLGSLNNYSTALRVTQPVFAGGSISARLNAGTLGTLLAEQSVRSAVEEVIYMAARAYYDLLLDQHLVEISKEAVRAAQAHLDSVKQKREFGVASNFDVLRAEVELSNFSAELIKNKHAINVAKANLLRVMGVSQESDVVLTNELVYVSEAVTLDDAVGAAFRNRPDLMGREFDTRLQKELLRIVKSQYWPSVDGFYENEWSKPDPHNSTLIDWGHAWNAGVAVTFPLFSGLSREGEVVSQKARLKQSQINLVDTEEQTLFEITKSVLSIADAAEFADSQKLNLTRAQEGLRLAEVGYTEGTQTQVEVIDAQSALTQARVFYYQAIYSQMVAKLNLQKAMGTLTGGKIKN